jgi:phosphoribosyl 1,2-cyclic phosphate phosphodiesterase
MSDFEFTFLGSGTSQGVPMIGCDCPVCTSTDPRDNRTRSSLFIRTAEVALAVDTGPDFRTQCLREHLSNLDAVIYTHAHTDHIMGFDDLRRFCDRRPGHKLPIYAAADTMADIQRVFGFAFDAPERFAGYVHPEPHIIQGPFVLGEIEITPLPVPHGRFIVNGYLFVRHGRRLLAYLSDCKSVPPEVRAQIMGVEALVIDALRYRLHPTHLSVDEALEVASAIGARQTWFTHLCHDLGHFPPAFVWLTMACGSRYEFCLGWL